MEANLKADLRDNSGSAESRRLRNAKCSPMCWFAYAARFKAAKPYVCVYIYIYIYIIDYIDCTLYI